MKGKPLRLICIGKIKTEHWKQACGHYLKHAARWRGIEVVELRDSDASLPEKTRIRAEGEKILAMLNEKDLAIALDENGENMSSRAFADFLHLWADQSGKKANFIIGGPFGLSEQVLARCPQKISLSRMTWPHELARALLLEQIFRADCILNNFPYHH